MPANPPSSQLLLTQKYQLTQRLERIYSKILRHWITRNMDNLKLRKLQSGKCLSPVLGVTRAVCIKVLGHQKVILRENNIWQNKQASQNTV